MRLFTLIASGFAVSADVDLSKYRNGLIGVWVPTITSGDMLVQGNFDTTSGNFARMLDTRQPGSADLRFATGPGSKWLPWNNTLGVPPFVRFEAGVVLTNPATLVVITAP